MHKFETVYVENENGIWIVYWSEFGSTKTRCLWLVPGTSKE